MNVAGRKPQFGCDVIDGQLSLGEARTHGGPHLIGNTGTQIAASGDLFQELAHGDHQPWISRGHGHAKSTLIEQQSVRGLREKNARSKVPLMLAPAIGPQIFEVPRRATSGDPGPPA